MYSTKRDLASHFSFPGFAALQQTLKSFSIITFSPFNRFCFPSCFHLILKLFMYYSVSWQLAWSVDWHLRVDGQPPSAVSIARDKCDEQWGRERSRPVIDTGATARGQSHASKNHRFSCPLNKQRDISARSHSCTVRGYDFSQPLQKNSSHPHQPWSNMVE